MSGSILQTAVTKKTLGLELDYRQPSVSRHGDASFEGLTTYSQLEPHYDGSRMWDEIAYLFRTI